jgi:glycosyltransferase involved in cell wall biosynthesis
MKFSIVTISLNQSKFIEQAITSVIGQEYSDIEYIVVDPGSTDGSREIIEKYNTRLDNIIFEPDEGAAHGLNKGFADATGEIYGYINADDFYEPGTFAHVADLFKKNSDIDVVCGAIRVIGAKGSARLRKRKCDSFDFKRFAAGAYTYCQQATFFRRRAFELTGGFNEKNKTCWDLELIVDMALSGSSFITAYKVLGNFRIHESSITGSGQMVNQYFEDYESIINKIRAKDIKLYAPFVGKLVKFIYKCNLRRHLSYLTVK